MNSKNIYHFPSTILYLAIIFILVQCSITQAASTNVRKLDDMNDNSMWNRASFDSELNDSDDDNDNSLPNFFIAHSAYKHLNEQKSLEPVRRANFWKRANFWRKRANFW